MIGVVPGVAEQERIREERLQAELDEIEQRLYAYHVQRRDMPEDEWNRRKGDLVRDEHNRLLDEREQQTIASLKARARRPISPWSRSTWSPWPMPHAGSVAVRTACG